MNDESQIATGEWLQEIQGALYRAQRTAALWTKPILSEDEAPQAIGVPPSTWSMLKSKGLLPKPFKLGRRDYYHTQRLLGFFVKLSDIANQSERSIAPHESADIKD